MCAIASLRIACGCFCVYAVCVPAQLLRVGEAKEQFALVQAELTQTLARLHKVTRAAAWKSGGARSKYACMDVSLLSICM
jgi:hypothetical protein